MMSVLNVLFLILNLLAALFLVIGIIKPKAFDKAGKPIKRITKSARLDNILIFGFLFILFGTLVGATAPKSLTTQLANSVQKSNTTSKTPSKPKAKSTTKKLTSKPAPKPAPKVTPKPQTPTTAQKVSTWNNKYGYLVTNLTKDFSKMQNDATNTNALENDCTQLFDDATVDETKPAIPDATAEKDWLAALNSYVNGAQQCQYGVNSSDVNEINKATADFNQGTKSLNAATAAIQKLG
jgi:hypothetical protein